MEAPQILSAETKEDYEELVEEKSKTWSYPFYEYFKRAIDANVECHAAWGVMHLIDIVGSKGKTTNQSEGFNFLLKSLNDWHEVPLDVIIVAFQMLQNFYIREIQRGYAGIGTYTLKKELEEEMSIPVERIPSWKVCSPENIVESIKNKTFLTVEEGTTAEKIPVANTKVTRAKEIIINDKISFSAKLGTFTILAASGQFQTVRLFPKAVCSCHARQNCCHILAVKISLNMDVKEELKMSPVRAINLTTLRKNAREDRKKPGRKRPRLGDVEIQPPPDSAVGQMVSSTPKPESKKKLDVIFEDRDDQEICLGHPLPVRNIIQDQQDLERDLKLEEDIAKEKQSQTIADAVSVITPDDDSFSKDVRYSLDVWIPADKEKLFYNINVSDRNILQSKAWLNDVIIDSSMNLLKYQFPDLEGFQPCYLAHQLDFQKHSKLFIQIINRTGGKGSHWLTVSNINCLHNEIGIYDSAFEDLPNMELAVVASLVEISESMLKVKFVDIQMQRNGYDCGLFAIANATALAFGRYPSQEVYDVKNLRSHLIKCLENKHITPFPTHNKSYKSTRRKVKIKKIVDVPLYCVCKKPDTGTIYVFCDACNKEYHPECVGLNESINESLLFICNDCRKK